MSDSAPTAHGAARAAIPRPAGLDAALRDALADADPARRELADAAARWVADGGLDYGSAKRRAVLDRYGHERAAPRGALPDNLAIDAALDEHLALFDDEHAARVQRMRGTALALMRRLQAYAPYLTGAVWKGIVAEHAPIHLQLFHDDTKDVQASLIDDGIDFRADELPHLRGDGQRRVEALGFEWQGEPVVLSLYRHDDLRGALRGVPAERGDAETVARLIDAAAPADRAAQ
jgi:hypothetical protein